MNTEQAEFHEINELGREIANRLRQSPPDRPASQEQAARLLEACAYLSVIPFPAKLGQFFTIVGRPLASLSEVVARSVA